MIKVSTHTRSGWMIDAAAGGGGGAANLRRFIDDNDDAQSDEFAATNMPNAIGAGGPDGPDVVPPPPEREYVSLIRLSDACIAADSEATDDEEFCFRCMIGKQMRSRNSSTHLESMDELIRTQYMFMSPDELTKRVQHMYNVNLRQSIECETMRKPWRRRVIWDHIHRHALTPDMATKYHLRVMGSTLEVLTTEGLVYKGATPGALKVDVQNLKVYTSMIKEYLRGLALVTESSSAQAASAAGRMNKRSAR